MSASLPGMSIQLKAPLPLRQTAGAENLPAQFTGIAYSGGLVVSYGVVVDVASTRIPKEMPLLMEHDRGDMVGVIDNAAARNSQIVVSGRLFSDMADTSAEKIGKLSKRGAQFQMSIGLFGYSEEFVAPGSAVSANGQTFTGPVTVLRGGMVRECSICTLGADPETSAAFFSETGTLPHVRDGEINQLFAALGETPSPEKRAALQKMKPADFEMLRFSLLQMRLRHVNLAAEIAKAAEENASLQRLVNSTAGVYKTRREEAARLHAPQERAAVAQGTRLSLWDRRRLQMAQAAKHLT